MSANSILSKRLAPDKHWQDMPAELRKEILLCLPLPERSAVATTARREGIEARAIYQEPGVNYDGPRISALIQDYKNGIPSVIADRKRQNRLEQEVLEHKKLSNRWRLLGMAGTGFLTLALFAPSVGFLFCIPYVALGFSLTTLLALFGFFTFGALMFCIIAMILRKKKEFEWERIALVVGIGLLLPFIGLAAMALIFGPLHHIAGVIMAGKTLIRAVIGEVGAAFVGYLAHKKGTIRNEETEASERYESSQLEDLKLLDTGPDNRLIRLRRKIYFTEQKIEIAKAKRKKNS